MACTGAPAGGKPYERMLDTLTRLCPDIVDAVSGYVTTWGVRFWQGVVPPNVMGTARV